jgi:hypothetical protein
MAAMQTFVVRVWTEAQAAGTDLDELRGIVEHLGSGQRGTFTDDDELLAFLRERWRPEERGRAEGETP